MSSQKPRKPWTPMPNPSERAYLVAALIIGICGIIAAWTTGRSSGVSAGQQQAFATAGIQQATSTVQATPTQVLTTSSPGVTPTLLPQVVNRDQVIDFENGIGNWFLKICDTDPCNWYNASQKLSVGQLGFSGNHSLEIKVDIIPNKTQIYSIQYLPDVTTTLSAASVKIYIPSDNGNPDTTLSNPLRVDLLVLPSSYERVSKWPISTRFINKTGWQFVVLDLPTSSALAGKPLDISTIDRIHIDLHIPASTSQQAETLTFRVDDVEIFR